MRLGCVRAAKSPVGRVQIAARRTALIPSSMLHGSFVITRIEFQSRGTTGVSMYGNSFVAVAGIVFLTGRLF